MTTVSSRQAPGPAKCHVAEEAHSPTHCLQSATGLALLGILGYGSRPEHERCPMPSETAPSTLAELPASHRNAIIGLAADIHCPVDLVAREYRSALTELEAEARIKQFLPAIASRRVRERL